MEQEIARQRLLPGEIDGKPDDGVTAPQPGWRVTVFVNQCPR
jgi:hypothetical protein